MMSTFKPKISLDVLPQNALTIKGNQFYCLVEKLTSSDVCRILKSQSINSINTFLLCKNILESILLPAPAFEELRRDTCVKLSNNSHIVQVGIIGQIDYLTELFRKKHLQEAKSAAKRRPTSDAISTPNPPSSTATSTIDVAANTSSIISTVTSRLSSIVDHRSNIISCINKWVINQGKLSGSNTVKLVEGTNYTLKLSSSADTAIVICQCSTRISFPKLTDGTFAVSNLYKHWKNTKSCNILTSAISSCSPSIPSSSSSNIQVTNDDEDDDDNLSPSSTRLIRPNARSTNKRAASSLSTIDTSSAKRRR